jgi:tRNA threonylcarbamoyladenosine biosynthesis protein TsaE
MPAIYQVEVSNLAETEQVGRRLGEHLFTGAVVGLIGPLGAGKTHLVRAIAEGLGLDEPRIVNSPTFVLIQEYEARLPIYHFDAYRLKSEEEFCDLGSQEYFQGRGVCLVEWADKVSGCLPAEYLRVEIKVTGEQTRQFIFTGYGVRYEDLVERMKRG